MKKYGKFAVLIAVVIAALVWLASTGVSETKTYYKTISRSRADGRPRFLGALARRGRRCLRLHPTRQGSGLASPSLRTRRELKVAYTGSDPLPDTFRDGAQALADGHMGHDGVFHASKIQAKCASKYEAKPSQLRAAPALPINKTT